MLDEQHLINSHDQETLKAIPVGLKNSNVAFKFLSLIHILLSANLMKPKPLFIVKKNCIKIVTN